MTQFSSRVLLLSLGHCITDVYQGGLPALLPFRKDKLVPSYTMTGVIMFLANALGSVLQPLFGYLPDKKEKAWRSFSVSNSGTH
jgi:MFS transporter, FSR family, fosmidomycin resistance protein